MSVPTHQYVELVEHVVILMDLIHVHVMLVIQEVVMPLHALVCLYLYVICDVISANEFNLELI